MLHRPRILRKNETVRNTLKETRLNISDLVTPLFLMSGNNKKEAIESMPGCFRYTPDLLLEEIQTLSEQGLKWFMLFGKIEDSKKDNTGKEALNDKGLIPETIRKIKQQIPDVVMVSDIALDPFSSYGHDGIVKEHQILNDETVQILSQMALVHAEAGADFVAPSDMMDGRVLGIREALEAKGYHQTGIISYSAKYASCFYGPFRDALDSSPSFGDKKTYQMDFHNINEAVKETLMDIDQGADIVMVKPGMPYLDVIRELHHQIDTPLMAYQVSGEYAMIKAASQNGWLDNDQSIIESLAAFKRAGCSLIATYFGPEMVRKKLL